MYYEKKLCKKYLGKRVTTDLSDFSSPEFNWDPNYVDDEETPGGTGMINLDYRPYRSDDDEDDEDDEYNEEDDWNIETGLIFTVDNDGEIENIEITARVYSYGDSGLGDCDPEEEWTDKDLELAEEFLDSITEEE